MTRRPGRTILVMLEMIKIEHTLFALPFALVGALLAVRGLAPCPVWRWGFPSQTTWAWILAAMFGARSAAMAFNRLADVGYDALNPRTAVRALPKGLLSRAWVAGFTVACAGLFLLSSWMLNPLCFALAFPALAVVLLYSYAKRFTILSHFILGYALCIAPEGAWIAVTGRFSVPVTTVCMVVLTWVAGFDILYACQDARFDSETGLYSVPGRLGVERSLRLSLVLHALTILSMGVVVWVFRLGALAAVGMGLLGAVLLWGHAMVGSRDLSRLNAVFFNLNALFSSALFLVVLADTLIFTGA